MSEPDLIVRRQVANRLGWRPEEIADLPGHHWWVDGSGRRLHLCQANDSNLPAWETDLSAAWRDIVPALGAAGWDVEIRTCETQVYLYLLPLKGHRRPRWHGELSQLARLLCEALVDVKEETT